MQLGTDSSSDGVSSQSAEVDEDSLVELLSLHKLGLADDGNRLDEKILASFLNSSKDNKSVTWFFLFDAGARYEPTTFRWLCIKDYHWYC